MEKVFRIKNRNNNINLTSIYLVVGLCCLTLINYSKLLDVNIIKKIHVLLIALDMVMIGLVVLCKIFQGDIRVNVLLVFIILLSFITLLIGRNDRMVCMVFGGLALCGCNKREFVKRVYKYLLITFILLLIFYCSGLMGFRLYSRGKIVRDSMGFGSATISNSIFMFIFFLGVWVYGKNITYTYLLFALGIAVLLYILTNTRVSFLLTILIIMIIAFLKLIKKPINLNKILKIIIISVPSFLLVLNVGLIVLYALDISIGITLNGILSSRLYLTYRAFKDVGVSFFGKNIVWSINGEYLGVDMCLPYILFNYGIFAFIFLQIYMMKMFQYAVDKKDIYLILIFFFITVGSLVEPYWVNYQYNAFALLCGLFFEVSDGCYYGKVRYYNNKTMIEYLRS